LNTSIYQLFKSNEADVTMNILHS